MFRGGDYYDKPNFRNPNQPIKNSLDISDINGAQSKPLYRMANARDSMNVNDINQMKLPTQYE